MQHLHDVDQDNLLEDSPLDEEDSQLVGSQPVGSQLGGSLGVEDILLEDSRLVEGTLQVRVGIRPAGDNGRERRALCQIHHACRVCPFHLPFCLTLKDAIT